jgi:hypothetical protein
MHLILATGVVALCGPQAKGGTTAKKIKFKIQTCKNRQSQSHTTHHTTRQGRSARFLNKSSLLFVKLGVSGINWYPCFHCSTCHGDLV